MKDLIARLLANPDNRKLLTLELANSIPMRLDWIDIMLIQKERMN